MLSEALDNVIAGIALWWTNPDPNNISDYVLDQSLTKKAHWILSTALRLHSVKNFVIVSSLFDGTDHYLGMLGIWIKTNDLICSVTGWIITLSTLLFLLHTIGLLKRVCSHAWIDCIRSHSAVNHLINTVYLVLFGLRMEWWLGSLFYLMLLATIIAATHWLIVSSKRRGYLLNASAYSFNALVIGVTTIFIEKELYCPSHSWLFYNNQTVRWNGLTVDLKHIAIQLILQSVLLQDHCCSVGVIVGTGIFLTVHVALRIVELSVV